MTSKQITNDKEQMTHWPQKNPKKVDPFRSNSKLQQPKLTVKGGFFSQTKIALQNFAHKPIGLNLYFFPWQKWDNKFWKNETTNTDKNEATNTDNNNNVFQKCNWFAQSSSLSFVFKNSKDENEVSLCNNCPKKRGNSH